MTFGSKKERKQEKIGSGITAHTPSSRPPARSYLLFDPIKQINDGKHDRKEDDGDSRTGPSVVHGPVATGPHDERVDLMGGQKKGI